MRSLMIFGLLALGLTACVDVHNPPAQAQQQPNTVIVPAHPSSSSTTTTVICPAGTIC
jgi:hypothetical protein